jgi:hypothetical protein
MGASKKRNRAFTVTSPFITDHEVKQTENKEERREDKLKEGLRKKEESFT